MTGDVDRTETEIFKFVLDGASGLGNATDVHLLDGEPISGLGHGIGDRRTDSATVVVFDGENHSAVVVGHIQKTGCR